MKLKKYLHKTKKAIHKESIAKQKTDSLKHNAEKQQMCLFKYDGWYRVRPRQFKFIETMVDSTVLFGTLLNFTGDYRHLLSFSAVWSCCVRPKTSEAHY